MIKLKKLTLTLVALLSTAAGAWAQTDNVNVTPVTGEQNKWTFTMPASNVELQVNYVPSYNVTFNTEGLDAEEAAKFTATPNTGVYKDETVTVTYTGTKRLIGFKAVKKAAVAYPLLSAATAEDIGKVVCAAGHLHDAKTAVPDACTAVGILGKVTETGHGLILALQNATEQEWNTINGWTSVDTYASTTLKLLPDADALGTNLTSYAKLGDTTVSNWAVGQETDYQNIFKNLGGAVDFWQMNVLDSNVNAYITTGVGGSALDGEYWTTKEVEDNGDKYAVMFYINTWIADKMDKSKKIRPVLGF